ncbi:MAG: TetR/AcrR family transcriptional regulator [Cyclobacteriaceae bacterium]
MPKSVTFDRESIMDKVTTLFWKKGFNATSMQDLVDVTNLNRSSIYNTFGDKEAIFEESLRHYGKIQSKFTQEALQASKSPLENIHSFIKAILSSIENDSDHKGCFISNCTAELGNKEGRVQQMLIENKDTVIGILQKKIEDAQKVGEINTDRDARRVAIFLFSSLQGLRITSILTESKTDLEHLAEDILKII